MQINDMINRESRAPHYLLHGTSKLTVDQAKLYFRKKLLFDLDQFSPELVSQVMRAYTSNGLVDVKRIFLEALATKDAPNEDTESAELSAQPLLNAGTVRTPAMPPVMRQVHHSPESIERLIMDKCSERQTTGLAHTNLYKLFREKSDDERLIPRKGILKILHMFDILLDKKDFEAFFAKHDRGDGFIEILPFLRVIFPPEEAESNRFAPMDEVKPTRPTLNFHEIVNRREYNAAPSAAPDRHRSVEDLLEHLRIKRHALESAAYAPPSSRPASAAATARYGPPSRPSATPVTAVSMGNNPFQNIPGSPSRGRSAQGGRQSSRATSANGDSRQRAESPSGKVVGFFAPTLDLFSTPHAEFAITSAREGSQFAVSGTGARPTSAPAGTLRTGPRFAQATHSRSGRSPASTMEDAGVQGLNVSKMSPRAPALSLAMPEPALFDSALHDIMQSSLQKALLELTAESPSASPSPVHTPHSPAYASPHSPMSVRESMSERTRPTSASATMRSRGASRGHSASGRGESISRDSSPVRNFFAESPSPSPALAGFGGNTEPIVLVSQVKQQPRVQRPSSAPSTHAGGSPRAQKVQIHFRPESPPSATLCEEAKVSFAPAEPRVPVLHIPKPEEVHKQRPKSSARRSGHKHTEAPAPCHYVMDPNYVDAADSLVFPDTPKLIAHSPAPSSRGPSSARTATTTHTLDSSAFSMSMKAPTFTGQARTKRIDPTGPKLIRQYQMYKNYNRTSNNEYGLFSTHFLKAVRKSNRLHEKQIRSRSPSSQNHVG